MTKYVIASILIIGGIIALGYYMFGLKSASQSPVIGQYSTDTLAANVASAVPENPQESASSSTPPPKITTDTKTHMITLKTNYGSITFETYSKDAPNTVANFITLSEKGFYDNLTFHRIIKGFMNQGGDPNGNGTGGPGYKFADEINPSSDLYKTGYIKGVVAMANSGPNTNGSQFFIMAADYPLPPSYTIFGKVVSGMDTVDKINAVKTGAGDRPVSPVVIEKVSVE